VLLWTYRSFSQYKTAAGNRLQSIALSALTTVYFIGVLLKTHSVEESDNDDIGNLMVVLLVGVVGAIAVVMVLEVYLMVHAIEEASGASKIFKNLPRVDPPPNTTAFYDIQVSLCIHTSNAHSFSCVYAAKTACALKIPVQKDNIGKDFHPVEPSILATISNQAKLEVVRLLTAENELKLDHFLHAVRNPPFWVGRGLVLVGSSLEVDGPRKCAVKYSRKTEESILAKACRPNILADNPAFGIEHVRDTFRYVILDVEQHTVVEQAYNVRVIWLLGLRVPLYPSGSRPWSTLSEMR
jgi:hypothetical protein